MSNSASENHVFILQKRGNRTVRLSSVLLLLLILQLNSCKEFEDAARFEIKAERILGVKSFPLPLVRYESGGGFLPEFGSSFSDDGTKLLYFYRPSANVTHLRTAEISSKAMLSDRPLGTSDILWDNYVYLSDRLIANISKVWLDGPPSAGKYEVCRYRFFNQETGNFIGSQDRHVVHYADVVLSPDGQKLLFTTVPNRSSNVMFEIFNVGDTKNSSGPLTFQRIYSISSTPDLWTANQIRFGKFVNDSVLVTSSSYRTQIHRILSQNVSELSQLRDKSVTSIHLVNNPPAILFGTPTVFYLFDKNTFSFIGELPLPSWIQLPEEQSTGAEPQITQVSVHPTLPFAFVRVNHSAFPALYADLINLQFGKDHTGFTDVPKFSKDGKHIMTQAIGADSTFVWRVLDISY